MRYVLLLLLVSGGCFRDQYALHGAEIDAALGEHLVGWRSKDGDVLMYRYRVTHKDTDLGEVVKGATRVERWHGVPDAGSVVILVRSNDARWAQALSAEFLADHPHASIHVVSAHWERIRSARQVRKRLKRRSTDQSRNDFSDLMTLFLAHRNGSIPPLWIFESRSDWLLGGWLVVNRVARKLGLFVLAVGLIPPATAAE